MFLYRGRFGVIRECKENATGRRFMAKIVPYEAEGKQNVLQEYEILKGLHHECIMTLHEAYITPRYLVLIAEHCTGKEILFHLVDRLGIYQAKVKELWKNMITTCWLLATNPL
uniref:Protein kinase domain-containing protein n=1 Tax=Pseudonaja textilis TaxID=8673 RepID=A0A670YUW7_PSETE